MKKIRYILFLMLCSFFSLGFVSAASISMKTSSSSVVVGNTVKVTVTVNGTGTTAGAVGAWEYCVTYDSSKLTLTSPSSPCVNDGLVGLTSASTVFTFKAKASGSSTVSLSTVALYDYDTEKAMSVTKGSVKITARTQQEIEASYSDNAYLSSLKVEGYSILPAFDKNEYSYTLDVENDVDSITIKATKADSGASLSGTGTKELTEGMNTFKIVVTAEKGNKKTYTISVNRKELNPIEVVVDGKTYTVVRKSDALEAPTYYSSTSVEIDGNEVPAFTSEITGYTLVGLKDEEGNIALFCYMNGTYQLYKQIATDGFVFVPEEPTQTLDGYSETKVISISENDVTVYPLGNDSDFVLVYGMNVSTGERGWYKYDTKEGTFQRYDASAVSTADDNQLYFLLTIVFASLSGLCILLLILLMVLNSKIRKKNMKLIAMIERNQQKVETISENVPKEEEEESSLAKKSSAEETIIQNIAKSNSDNFEVTLQDTKMDIQEEIEEDVHDTEILEEVPVSDASVSASEKMSKRELRRLEKQKQKQEQEEMKKMQEDFLKTEEQPILFEEEKTEKTKKSKNKKRKK